MQRRDNLRSWKRPILPCLAFALGAVVVIGAKNVTLELKSRPEQRELVAANLREWGRMLTVEVAEGSGEKWEQLVAADPGFVIRACTSEAAEEDGNDSRRE